MAKDERNTGVSTGKNLQGWEESEFPVLCETCLGDNPYVRMMKENYGAECRVCTRPYTVFRWKAGTKGRFKRTVLCQTCAKLKNVCQTCIFDLQFGLPVEVRDKFLAENKIDMPQQIAIRDYWQNQMNKHINDLDLPYHNIAKNPLLEQFSRMKPEYDRNLPKMCSFWKKGECTRGEQCPYLHKQIHPDEGPLCKQNIKNRFLGRNDPLASQIVHRMLETQKNDTAPPSDETVKSICIRNLASVITQNDLESVYKNYGEIVKVKIIRPKQLAFIEYQDRDMCQKAIDETYGKLIIKEVKISVAWAKPHVSINFSKLSRLAQVDQPLVMPENVPRPEGEPDKEAEDQEKTNEILIKLLKAPKRKMVDYSDDDEPPIQKEIKSNEEVKVQEVQNQE